MLFTTLRLALPIALQVLLFSARGLTDMLMVGRLGQVEVAAVGIAGKLIFIFALVFYGLASAASLLATQYQSAGQSERVQQLARASLLACLLAGTMAMLAAGPGAALLLQLASHDPLVQGAGVQYLHIVALSLLASACLHAYGILLRNLGHASIVTLLVAIGVLLNALLNWLLIFGKAGFPELGLAGAAWATLLSALLEVGLLLLWLHWRQPSLAPSRLALWRSAHQSKLLQQFRQQAWPLCLSGGVWASGVFSYHALVGQRDTQALAVLSLLGPIESAMLALLIGIASASGIVLGQRLGQGAEPRLYQQSWQLVGFSALLGLLLAALFSLSWSHFPQWFPALAEVPESLLSPLLLWISLTLALKSLTMPMIIGLLRAGGDTRFCLWQDMLALWCWGLPLTAAVTLIWPQSWSWVVLALLAEELAKLFASSWRVSRRHWLTSLVLQDDQKPAPGSAK